MVQSPSWAANWFAASQEIPRISRNPMVHHRTHKRPPPVSYHVSGDKLAHPQEHFLTVYKSCIYSQKVLLRMGESVARNM